ncbi:hypothetical protein [Mycetocola saprophilus]|uniref:hypothetical protein n=1 Tax=Mycetocola saprophilus TaxID=76636 RepID=UPI003BF064A2
MGEVKKPQDHKKKVEVVDGAFRVTVRGIDLSVPKDVMDDFELLDDLAAAQKRDAVRLPSMLHRLVGEDFGRVMDGLRGENGRVSLEEGSEFVKELFEAIAPNS